VDDRIANTGFCCLACGGKELCLGYQGTAASMFIPSNMFTLNGYRIRTYVCLKCGHVGQYMSKDRLQKLRERYFQRFLAGLPPDTE